MNDVDSSKVKKRFWIVMSWVQFSSIAAGTYASTILLLGGYIGGLASSSLNDHAALLAVTFLAVTVISVMTFIFTGKFRFSPSNHRKKQVAAIILIFASTSIFVLTELKRDTAEATLQDQEQEAVQDSRNYLAEELVYRSERFIVLTHKTTSRKAIYKSFGDVNNLDFVVAIVVNNTLVSEAIWGIECKPDTSITKEIRCDSDGDSARAVYSVQPDSWDYEPILNNPSALRWSLSDGGFKVYVDFTQWPLELLRQNDTTLMAEGRQPRDLANKFKSVVELFHYEAVTSE